MSDNDVNAHVKHEADRHRFIIEVDGEVAGFAEYAPTAAGDVRDFNHTVVHPEFRGQGLSSTLIKSALDETREAGMHIIPTCSAVAHFVSKNHEYADLVVD